MRSEHEAEEKVSADGNGVGYQVHIRIHTFIRKGEKIGQAHGEYDFQATMNALSSPFPK